MKIFALVKAELKIHKKEIIGWMLAMFFISFFYTFLFPSVKDIAQAKMEAMPEALLKMVGMASMQDMGNYIHYSGIILGMLLIAITIFASIFASRILLDEERNQTIEFLYAMPLSRTTIYMSKFITCFIVTWLVVVCAIAAMFLCGYLHDEKTFVVMDMMKISKVCALIPFIFMCISFGLAGSSKKASGMVGCGIVMISYFAGYLSSLLSEDYEWLSYSSPFQRLSYQHAIQLDEEVMITLLCYLAIAAIFIIIGLFNYKKRDL